MARRWWIIWLLFAALMGFIVGATFVSAYDIRTQPHAAHEITTKTDQKNTGIFLWRDAGTTANVLVAAFTGALVVTAILQIIFLSKANSVAAAAANEAKASNIFAREVFQTEHRPWLAWTLNPIVIIRSENGTLHITVEGELHNIGKTPALNVTYFGKFYSPDQKTAAVDPGVAFYTEHLRQPAHGALAHILPNEKIPIRFGPYGIGLNLIPEVGRVATLWLAFHARYQRFGSPKGYLEIGSIYMLQKPGAASLAFERSDFGPQTIMTLVEFHGARRIT